VNKRRFSAEKKRGYNITKSKRATGREYTVSHFITDNKKGREHPRIVGKEEQEQGESPLITPLQTRGDYKR